VRLLGSLVDFERALARGDDPVPDYGDMFAGVALVDLGSFWTRRTETLCCPQSQVP